MNEGFIFLLCAGLLVLKELGIEVDIYVASEIDGDALRVSIYILHSYKHVKYVNLLVPYNLTWLKSYSCIIHLVFGYVHLSNPHATSPYAYVQV